MFSEWWEDLGRLLSGDIDNEELAEDAFNAGYDACRRDHDI